MKAFLNQRDSFNRQELQSSKLQEKKKAIRNSWPLWS